MDCAGSLGSAIYLHACGLTREPERKTFGADTRTSIELQPSSSSFDLGARFPGPWLSPSRAPDPALRRLRQEARASGRSVTAPIRERLETHHAEAVALSTRSLRASQAVWRVIESPPPTAAVGLRARDKGQPGHSTGAGDTGVGTAVVPSLALPECRSRALLISSLVNPTVHLDFYQIRKGCRKLSPVAT